MHYTAKLLQFTELEDGWDGRGSKKPTDAALSTAHNLTPVPGGDGSLQLELHAGGCDLEIEIDPAGRVLSVLFSLVN